MHDRNKSEKRTMVNERNRNYRVNHNPRRKQYNGVNHYIKRQRKGMKKMNIIRNVFRDLLQPIQVEARFPLITWALLLLAVIIAMISKIQIICQ